MVIHKIERYTTQIWHGSGHLLVLIDGNERYKELLINSFPNLSFSATFADSKKEYKWGTFIREWQRTDAQNIVNLLDLCTKHVLVVNPLDQMFCIDFHTDLSGKKSELGELVYKGKTYKSGPIRDNQLPASEKLTTFFLKFILQNFVYSQADLILSVPSSTHKTFDLPAVIASGLSKLIGKPMISSVLEKIPGRKSMKDCSSLGEKMENIVNSFIVKNTDEIQNKSIILIDDVYQSGATMIEVGKILKLGGAAKVLGLSATKTRKDA